MTLGIETLSAIGKLGDGKFDLKYKILLGISFTYFFLFITILTTIILKGAKNTKTHKNPSSKSFAVISSGLKKTHPFFTLIYYAHFLLIRFLLTLFVFLTPFLNTRLLWLFIPILQFIALAAHTLKFYAFWSLYLQGLIREIYILAITIFLTIV